MTIDAANWVACQLRKLEANPEEDLGLTEYFYNIPRSMFTAFRCFTGECVTGWKRMELCECCGVNMIETLQLEYCVCVFLLVFQYMNNLLYRVQVSLTCLGFGCTSQMNHDEGIEMYRMFTVLGLDSVCGSNVTDRKLSMSMTRILIDSKV